MNPTLSFSCALAPVIAAIARPAAAAAIMNRFIALSELLREALSGCGARMPRLTVIVQRSGTKASPSEAGAGLPARPLHQEIATRTRMVARYGSADISCDR